VRPPTSVARSLADEDALDAFVADADAAVIEFYTDGCGICASMEPVLGNVARELDLAVATVNPRDDPPLVERFDVRSVPLFVLFVDGEPVARRAEGSSRATISPRGSRTASRNVRTDHGVGTPEARTEQQSRFRVAYNEVA